MAAPTPTPAKPCSVIGVSITPPLAELLQEVAGDLVGALVLGDFLAHQENRLVAAHLLGHGVAQGVADGLLDQLGVGGDLGIGQGLGRDDRRGALAFRLLRLGLGGLLFGIAGASGGVACWTPGWGAWPPFGFGAGAGAAAPSSPFSRAIGVLTFTFSAPSGTSNSSTTPSSTASTSMVALSVSISAITSPDATLSPGFTCHLARVPSSMVGDRAGIRTSTLIRRRPLHRRRCTALWGRARGSTGRIRRRRRRSCAPPRRWP